MRWPPARPDFGFELLQAVEAAGGERDLGACVGQHAGEVQPEAGGRPRHQGRLAGEREPVACHGRIRRVVEESYTRDVRRNKASATAPVTGCGPDNARA